MVSVAKAFTGVRRVLPEGRQLPHEIWWSRHRGILVLLWVHAAIIPAFALSRGFSLGHAIVEGLVVPIAAVFAMSAGLSRRARTAAASLGLLSSSAILVHLSGGVIEMHFHFFVMVTVVALYQDWLPFLAAIGYVFIHHGLMGAVDADSVYNHPAAWANPWKWAGIHAFFISGISVVCLVTWRLNELILAQRKLIEERLREERQIVETLNEAGKAVAAELDAHRLIQTVTDMATQVTRAEYGAFYHSRSASLGAIADTFSGAVAASKELAAARKLGAFLPALTPLEALRIDDVTEGERPVGALPERTQAFGPLPVRSYLAVPVRSRTGEVIGGLFFGHPEPGRFSEADERIVTGIAAHAAIAIDNARLYESEREARRASEAAQSNLLLLADASKVLTASLEVDGLLRELTGLLVPSVADLCAIHLAEEDGSLRQLDAMPDATGEGTTLDPTGTDEAHPIVRVVNGGQRELIGDGADLEVLTGSIGRGDRVSTALILPMAGRSDILGCLTLATKERSGRHLGPEDLAFGEELARRAALAVENARLYLRQRTVAETLQHSLLPESLPEIPGLSVAARYIAGGPDVEVGGDWYDVIQLHGGKVALVMGDVVGRGEQAASLMGQLRNATRAYALERRTPKDVVELVNHLLHELGPDQMATMVFGILDLESCRLTTVNAGHPPPLLINHDGSVGYMPGPVGVPIGAKPHARYVEMDHRMVPGSTIVLYTDGLVEDRFTPLDEGFEALAAAARVAPGETEGLVEHLVREALHGRKVGDDAAALAFRLHELGDLLRLRLPTQPQVLAPLRASIRRWLSEARATEQEIEDILIAVGEASANAIQHASGPSLSHFELEARRSGNDVHITMRDRGRWRQRRSGVGGRGLEIIETLMDSVHIKREGGTEITMRRRLGARLAETGP